MGMAGINPKSVRAIFITHNHSDHMADVGTLPLRLQQSGLRDPVTVVGPAPISMMMRAYAAFADWDVQLRVRDENRPQYLDLVKVREIAPTEEGLVYQDANVKVTAFFVDHGAAQPAYGFRFETPDRVVVFSGDTRYSPNLVKYARGADYLVHEVLAEGSAQLAANVIDPGNTELARHIQDAHSLPQDVGRVATEAGVKNVVLTHFVPSGNPQFDKPELWKAGVAKTFAGNVIVSEDLMELR